jgi:hypothetical protein
MDNKSNERMQRVRIKMSMDQPNEFRVHSDGTLETYWDSADHPMTIELFGDRRKEQIRLLRTLKPDVWCARDDPDLGVIWAKAGGLLGELLDDLRSDRRLGWRGRKSRRVAEQEAGRNRHSRGCSLKACASTTRKGNMIEQPTMPREKLIQEAVRPLPETLLGLADRMIDLHRRDNDPDAIDQGLVKLIGGLWSAAAAAEELRALISPDVAPNN